MSIVLMTARRALLRGGRLFHRRLLQIPLYHRSQTNLAPVSI